jgi:hypothetical protein
MVPPLLVFCVCPLLFQHNLEVIARLKGVTPQSLMQDMNEREARGETVRGECTARSFRSTILEQTERTMLISMALV